MNFLDSLSGVPVFAILRNVPNEKLIPLCDALIAGGMTAVEIPFDRTGTVSDAETAKSIEIISSHYKDKIFVGAGTVLKREQLRLAYQSGASFIVSPNTDKKIIRLAKAKSVISIPGAMTPTEIEKAIRYGADAVKIFPCDILPPAFIKAVLTPFNGISLIMSGGIDENNIKDYLNAGALGAGIGGTVIEKSLIEAEDYNRITEKIKCLVNACKESQNGNK